MLEFILEKKNLLAENAKMNQRLLINAQQQ